MLLTDTSWLAIREAIEIGSSIFIPATNGGSSFSLEWLPQVYISPVDGKHYIGEGSWNKYLPSSPRQKVDGEAIEMKEIILLSSEQEFAARVQTEDLGSYFKKVEKALQETFQSYRSQTKQDLVIEFEITSNNQVSLSMASRLKIDKTLLDNVAQSILNISSPEVKNHEIKFQIVFAVLNESEEE